MNRFFLAIGLLGMLSLTACDQPQAAQATVKNTQAAKAAQAANSINFTENAEIDNIKARIELTSRPGAIGYVMLINQAGQPILYATVKGKVTSGGKRLTAPYQVDKGWNCGGQYGCYKDLPSPSDEGTWGSSSDYLYFWTVSGQYYQWAGNYLYSDQPFRLKVEPLVVDIATK